MRIIAFAILVGICVGNIIYDYKQEINKIYDSNIQFEIALQESSNGSF